MKGIAFGLLLTFLFQIGVKTGVLIWFKVNQTYISQTECVNRYRPMMHCDGKCVLSEKLKQAEQKHDNKPLPLSEIDNEILPCIVGEDHSLTKDLFAHLQFNFLSSRYSYLFPKELFHPPPSLV